MYGKPVALHSGNPYIVNANYMIICGMYTLYGIIDHLSPVMEYKDQVSTYVS